MLLEKKMNINKSVFDYIRYKYLNWYGHVQETMNKCSTQKNWNGIHLEKDEEGGERENLKNSACRKYLLK